MPRLDLRRGFSAAMPLRSVPDEAAVADVFGTFAVLVALTR